MSAFFDEIDDLPLTDEENPETRDITDEEAKIELLEYFQENPDNDEMEAAEDLNLDINQTTRVCDELAEEGW